MGWAAAVLVLDLAKGAVAVLLAQSLYQAGLPGSTEWVAAAAGVAAVVGHNWSVFIGFTGGRRGDLGGRPARHLAVDAGGDLRR